MFNVFEWSDEQVVDTDFEAAESSYEEYQDFSHNSYSEHVGDMVVDVRTDIEGGGVTPVSDSELSDLSTWLNRNKNSPEAANYKTDKLYVAFGGGYTPTNHVLCMVWSRGSFTMSTIQTWDKWTTRHVALTH